MNALHCLALLALLVLSIAAPNKLAELPTGAHWENGNIVVLPNEPPTPQEQAHMAGLDALAYLKEFATTNYRAESADTSRYTNTSLTSREDPKVYAEMWMSGDRRNVGTLRGPRLWWKLMNCFNAVCKVSDNRWECNDTKNLEVCKIQNVVSTKHGEEDWDATSTITVSYRLVKNSFQYKLDYPTHEMLATMFSFMVEQEGNCRWVNFKWSRRTKICNVAHRALFAFPMEDEKSEPQTVFIATIETDAPKAGEFHCDAPLRNKVYTFFHNVVKKELVESTKIEGYVEAQVKCQADDQCWHYDNWRKCFNKGVW